MEVAWDFTKKFDMSQHLLQNWCMFCQQWTWLEYKQVKCILHIILENLFHALFERDDSVSIDERLFHERFDIPVFMFDNKLTFSDHVTQEI